jgi:CMP-N,N'-diacetyllegionaminic acid synthase
MIVGRGGSKGVPGKNLREINGLSLIAYKARSALRSKYCARLIISSDCEKIQAEAAKYGAEVLFTRPAELASDTASSDDVVLHAMNEIEKTDPTNYNAIMLLEPTSPFAKPEDYDAAIEIYLNTNAALVVGMKPSDTKSLFVGPLAGDGNAEQIISKFSDHKKRRRQNLAQEYTMNGGLYLIDWKTMKQTGNIYSSPAKTYAHVMDRLHSVNIDEEFDFSLAQFLVEGGQIDPSSWL